MPNNGSASSVPRPRGKVDHRARLDAARRDLDHALREMVTAIGDALDAMAPTVVPNPDAGTLLSVTRAAELLDCSTWTVRRMVRDGLLVPIKLGADTKIPLSELIAYIEGQRALARQPR